MIVSDLASLDHEVMSPALPCASNWRTNTCSKPRSLPTAKIIAKSATRLVAGSAGRPAADIDGRELVGDVIDPYDPSGNTETHDTFPSGCFFVLLFWKSMRCAAPTAAWPSARPPSLAGTSACRSTVKSSLSRRRVTSSNRTGFLKQPPDRATVVKRRDAASSSPLARV